MPRIVGDLAAPEAAGMLGDDLAVLADGDPIGIGPHVHRSPHRACRDAVLVVVEAQPTRKKLILPEREVVHRQPQGFAHGGATPFREFHHYVDLQNLSLVVK